jgi:hypothetical protein
MKYHDNQDARTGDALTVGTFGTCRITGMRDFNAFSTITGGIKGGNVFTCIVKLPDGETVRGIGSTLESAEDTAWYGVAITLRDAATV